MYIAFFLQGRHMPKFAIGTIAWIGRSLAFKCFSPRDSVETHSELQLGVVRIVNEKTPKETDLQPTRS